MSAFVVSDKTINQILAILWTSDMRWYRDEIISATQTDANDPAILGRDLAVMNREAVSQRYGGEPEPLTYKFHWESNCTQIQAMKSLDCYLYQCHEGDVMNRPLYKAMDRLRNNLARHIVSNLPQYDKAKWDA